MTHDEFLAEASRRFGYRKPAKPVIQDPLDALDGPTVKELLPDYLRNQVGNPRKVEHPLIDDILQQKLTLRDLQTRSGLTASDFAVVMQDSLAVLLVSKFGLFSADFNQFSRSIDAPNFKPLATATLSAAEPAEVFEGAELPTIKAKVTEGGRKGQLRSFCGKISFSRAVWETYGGELVEGILAYANVFAQIEQRIVAETLESATLTTATGSLNAAGLGVASKTLRSALNAAGQTCGLGIHCLVIPPALEATARQLRADMGGWPAFVVVNSFLTSDVRYFAFANPVLSAPLLRLRLRYGGVPRIYTNKNEMALKAQFAFEHDVDYVVTPAVPGIVEVAP